MAWTVILVMIRGMVMVF